MTYILENCPCIKQNLCRRIKKIVVVLFSFNSYPQLTLVEMMFNIIKKIIFLQKERVVNSSKSDSCVLLPRCAGGGQTIDDRESDLPGCIAILDSSFNYFEHLKIKEY